MIWARYATLSDFRLKTILTPCSRNSETTRARPYGPSFVIWRLSLLIVRLSCGKRLRFDVGLSSRSAFEEPLNCTRCTLDSKVACHRLGCPGSSVGSAPADPHRS